MTREANPLIPTQHTEGKHAPNPQLAQRVAGFCVFVGRCVLDFVFPPQCCVCGALLGEEEAVVCEGCWREFPVIGDKRCVRCGAPSDLQTEGCPSCPGWGPSFRCARILAPFDGQVREVIHLLKYEKKRSIGARLGAMLAAVLRDDPRFQQVDLVLPVPLHKVRLKQRGYNQSELLARPLSEILHRPVHTDLLVRTRNTSDQTKLNAAERRANVAGAFKVTDSGRVQGKCVALVDDVVTTGATVEACTQVLLAAGAQSVLVVAVGSPFLEKPGDTGQSLPGGALRAPDFA